MLSTSKGVKRRNLQTLPKIIIKWQEYQIENFPEKSMFSTLKAKTSSKFVLWQPDEICRFDSKSLKNQNINFPKTTYVYYLKSVKEPKDRMKATRQNSPRSLKNDRTQVKFKKTLIWKGEVHIGWKKKKLCELST
jgi:hypothetical protein